MYKNILREKQLTQGEILPSLLFVEMDCSQSHLHLLPHNQHTEWKSYLFSSFKSLRNFSALVSIFFAFCLSSLAACFSLISKDFFFEPKHHKKDYISSVNMGINPHSTPSKCIHQECFTRIPRPKINIVQEFGIDRYDRFIFKDHIAVFIPLKNTFDQSLQWYP